MKRVFPRARAIRRQSVLLDGFFLTALGFAARTNVAFIMASLDGAGEISGSGRSDSYRTNAPPQHSSHKYVGDSFCSCHDSSGLHSIDGRSFKSSEPLEPPRLCGHRQSSTPVSVKESFCGAGLRACEKIYIPVEAGVPACRFLVEQ